MGKSQPKSAISDVLRTVIRDSGLSAYRISEDTGLVVTSIIRFTNGETSLHLDKADRLAAYLGLKLAPDPDAERPEPTPESLARPMLAKRKRKRRKN